MTAPAVEGAIGAIEHTVAEGLNAAVAFDPATVRAQRPPTGGLLTGVPLGIKDNICTVEYPTTCASRVLEHYRSPFEATAVTRLKAAGAVIACKTNLDEFGMGSSTERSIFGRCRHPLDGQRVPGGSSGGSAALVASGAVPAALGSETGGSVRQPAAFCGVVGVKPSYGRVSRFGLVAFGSSLDQIGVFGRTVDDASRVLQVVSGRDPRDATCAERDPVAPPSPRSDLGGLTVGLPVEYFPDDLDPGVREACDRAVQTLRDAGAAVRDVALPHAELSVPCYYVIAPAEASTNLARFDGVRFGARIDSGGDLHALYRSTRGEGFGPEVRRRIIVGTYVLSSGYYAAFYKKAAVARGRIAEDFHRVFADGVDLLFTPTTPSPAFEAGSRLDDPVAMYREDVFVCAANLVGLPALSLPIGRVRGLPVGGQFLAPMFQETVMLEAAAVLEDRTEPVEEM